MDNKTLLLITSECVFACNRLVVKLHTTFVTIVRCEISPCFLVVEAATILKQII